MANIFCNQCLTKFYLKSLARTKTALYKVDIYLDYYKDLIEFVDMKDEERAILFLDQMKAFDRIEWEWLEK